MRRDPIFPDSLSLGGVSGLGKNMFDYDRIVGSIYDCAANPELWLNTLCDIRDAFDGAYALVAFADISGMALGQPPAIVKHNSPWDETWLKQMEAAVAKIPGGGGIFDVGLDVAWTQLGRIDEAAFKSTDFYRTIVQPQGLRDTMNTTYVQRTGFLGMLSTPSYAKREPFGTKEILLAQRLTPHIRRAMLINDLTDKGKLALALYRQVLDQLSVAVFVVGLGRRIVFTNAAGDAMLSEGNHVHSVAGALNAQRIVGAPAALDDAIDRASKGDVAIGISGIGVPLVGANGERSAAYVLPIAGKDIRGDLGKGHCAVFISQRGEQQPMAIEILRTVFDLSPTEARVAQLISNGDNPSMIAESLNLSINTIRTHLAKSFAKTGTGDQTALGALVNKLMPPIIEK